MSSISELTTQLELLTVKGLATEKISKRMGDRLNSSDSDDVEEATDYITATWSAYEKTLRAKKVEVITLSGSDLLEWRQKEAQNALDVIDDDLAVAESMEDLANSAGVEVDYLNTLAHALGHQQIEIIIGNIYSLPAPKMKRNLETGEITSASNNRLRDKSDVVDGKVFSVENGRGKTTKNEKVIEVASADPTGTRYTLDGVGDFKAVKIVSSKTDENGNRHAQITEISRAFPLEAVEGRCSAETEFQQLENARVWNAKLKRWALPDNYKALKAVRVACGASVKAGCGGMCKRHSNSIGAKPFTGLGAGWAQVVIN